MASAPKAEVGLAGSSLFAGRVRAQRLSLVGAEMQVRIEPDGKVTVFAGNENKRPFVTASAARSRCAAGMVAPLPQSQRWGRSRARRRPPHPHSGVPDLAALLAWIDGLASAGLDGHDLSELGLKNGNLTVDDQRNGKTVDVPRHQSEPDPPDGGGIALTVGSEAANGPGCCARP